MSKVETIYSKKEARLLLPAINTIIGYPCAIRTCMRIHKTWYEIRALTYYRDADKVLKCEVTVMPFTATVGDRSKVDLNDVFFLNDLKESIDISVIETNSIKGELFSEINNEYQIQVDTIHGLIDKYYTPDFQQALKIRGL